MLYNNTFLIYNISIKILFKKYDLKKKIMLYLFNYTIWKFINVIDLFIEKFKL